MRYSILAMLAALLTSSIAAAASFDQLAATKHNFTNPASPYQALLGTADTMCQPCHTPHHALSDDKISARLWNHALSSATYTLYDGSVVAFGGTNIDGAQGMDRVSRLCLGCHDGTVALDSFGIGPSGNPAGHVGTTPFDVTNVNNLGTNFTDDHPVGITARATDSSGALLPGSHLKAPTVTLNDSTPGVKSVKIGNISLAKMDDGYFVVGCKSCHNPHGSGTAALTPYPHLLADAAATLCNNCHTK